MSTLLHPEFLRSEEAFNACTGYWQQLFRTALRDAGLDPTEWGPWQPRHLGNGALMAREDRPVFEARSIRLDRSVQIIQWEPSTEYPSGVLSGWIKDYAAEGFPDTFSAHGLFLNLVLDAEVARLVSAIFAEWADPTLDIETLRERLEHMSESSHS